MKAQWHLLPVLLQRCLSRLGVPKLLEYERKKIKLFEYHTRKQETKTEKKTFTRKTLIIITNKSQMKQKTKTQIFYKI